MSWGISVTARTQHHSIYFEAPNLSAALCSHCQNYSLWLTNHKSMIFPISGIAPLPNPDLPDEIFCDYMEARSISTLSPRGSAALLRLCIQKLCKHLGEAGKDINYDISQLVQKGLNPNIQKSLDIVRVIGNESVHPGTFDLRDDPDTARTLFLLVNIIADSLITQPKIINETYNLIPENKRNAISARDSKPNP